MHERKTAFDAINSDSVHAFIKSGPKTDVQTQPAEAPRLESDGDQLLHDQQIRQTEPPRMEPSTQSRTFAKARIQKSIRFRPELIDQLEQLIVQLELSGNDVPSIQSVMNEALAMWLHSRDSTK